MAGSTSARPDPPAPPASDGTTGVYGISTAAQLAGMSVQALRLYERKGLLAPGRTTGGTRRYSDTDIARLRRISVLIAEGINLTGIARVLGLEADNADLHAHNTTLRNRNTTLTDTNNALRADDGRPPARPDPGTTPSAEDNTGRRRSDRSGRQRPSRSGNA